MALPIAWTLTLLGAVLAGASIVALLVVKPSWEPAAFIASSASAAISGWALLSLGLAYETFVPVLIAAALGLAAAVGGYWLAASLLPLLEKVRRPRRIPPPAEDGSEAAYVLLSRAEPQRYSPSWTAGYTATISAPEGSSVPVAFQPFLFAAQKARYRAVSGRSPARETVHGLAQRLTRLLGVPEVRVAFCEPADSLSDAVGAAVASGHARIVVAPLAVATGTMEERAHEKLRDLLPEDGSIVVSCAESLWSSGPIAELVAERTRMFVADDPDAGIVVVVEGQPPGWAETHGEFDEREATFAARVTSLLAEEGLAAERVRVASADWDSPDIADAVRHLAALGCERIAVVPAVFPTESLATMIDLPRAAAIARTRTDITVLPPWGNESVVAAEIAERMLQAKRETSQGAE